VQRSGFLHSLPDLFNRLQKIASLYFCTPEEYFTGIKIKWVQKIASLYFCTPEEYFTGIKIK